MKYKVGDVFENIFMPKLNMRIEKLVGNLYSISHDTFLSDGRKEWLVIDGLKSEYFIERYYKKFSLPEEPEEIFEGPSRLSRVIGD